MYVFSFPQKIMTKPILKINNKNIERVTDFDFLGLIISSNLKWNKHIDHIALKISNATGILYRLKSIFPRDALLTLYSALIMPHFHHCLLVWGSNVKNSFYPCRRNPDKNIIFFLLIYLCKKSFLSHDLYQKV